MRFFKSTVLGLTVLGGIYGMTERSMAAGGQSEQVFQKQITKTVELKYLLHLPTGYGDNQDQKWPVMLFLHGAGERGSDLN